MAGTSMPQHELSLEEIIKRAKWPRNRGGTFEVDGVEVAATIQCVHCGKHHFFFKDLDVGFCVNCQGPTCPTDRCNKVCLPIEKRFEMLESGKMKSFFDPNVT